MMQKKIHLFLLLVLLFQRSLNARNVCYHDVTVYQGEQFIAHKNFCYDQNKGKILSENAAKMAVNKSGFNITIIPGLIDVQLNGAFGHDFTSNPQSVFTVAKQIGKTGVTAFCPTIISSSKQTYEKAARLIVPKKTPMGAEILKIHCEGPFITRFGTHNKENSKQYSIDKKLSIKDLLETYGPIIGKTSIITLAPEYYGSNEVISYLARSGIVPSLGHSGATYEEGINALAHGARFFTHLFNTMVPIHHRAPGLPSAALVGAADNKPYYGIIADDIHVHGAMVKLAYLANPNLVLTTDAMAGLGLEKGNSIIIGDVEVYIIEHIRANGNRSKKAVKSLNKKPVIVNNDYVLAGSIISMIDALNILKDMLGPDVSWAQVIKTATINPAHLLNIDFRKNLTEGSDADFLVLEGDFSSHLPSNARPLTIKETVSNGKTVYSAPH